MHVEIEHTIGKISHTCIHYIQSVTVRSWVVSTVTGTSPDCEFVVLGIAISTSDAAGKVAARQEMVTPLTPKILLLSAEIT